MFFVTIRMTVVPEKREELYQTFSALVRDIRAEGGCLRCDFWRSVFNKNEICLGAEWDSEKSMAIYLDSDFFNIVLGVRSLLKNPPEVTVYTVVVLLPHSPARHPKANRVKEIRKDFGEQSNGASSRFSGDRDR